MARKKSKHHKKPSAKQATEDLLPRYHTLAEKGKWQEAMKVAKELLKREGPDRLPLLIDAYIARALALEAKGMFQEALIFLQNAANHGKDERVENASARLWFRTADWTKLATYYSACIKQGDQAKTATLDPWLAASLLGGVAELEDHLPATCPPLRHLAAAREAMVAFCEGRDQDLVALLKTIPFRSPYRDFCLILKGFSASAADATRLDACLARLAPNSAFRHLAESLSKGRRGVDLDFSVLTPAETSLALSQMGLSNAAVATCEKLLKLPADKAAAFLVKQDPAESGLPPSMVQAFVADHLPHDLSLFSRFSSRFDVPPYEKARFQALAHHHQETYLDTIQDRVMDYIEALQKDQQASNKNLRCGLVLLWLGNLYLPEDLELADEEFELWDCLRFWEDSLKYDPKNPTTYLNFLSALTQFDHPVAKKKRHAMMEQAIKSLPDHPAILEAAMDAAIERKVYKKAARYAKQLLARDSVNFNIRRRLVTALLGHADKKLAKKQWAAAAREVDQAAEFARREAGEEQVAIYRARIELGQKRVEEAQRLLHQGHQACPNMLSRLLFVQTCQHLAVRDQSIQSLVKQWYVELQNLEPTEAHLHQVLNYINIQDNEKLQAFMSPFTKFFKACAGLPLDEKILIRACENLIDAGLFKLTASLAREASNHSAKPHFTFYLMFAKWEGTQSGLSQREIGELNKVAQQALDMGYLLLAHAIESLSTKAELYNAMYSNMGMDFDAPFAEKDAMIKQLLEIYGGTDVD